MKTETKMMYICGWPAGCAYKDIDGYCCGKIEDECLYKIQPKPTKPLKDLVFGDEIEVKLGDEWKPAKFVGFHEGDVWMVVGNKHFPDWCNQHELTWRLPLKSRMCKGQPVVVGKRDSIRLFSHFVDEELYTFSVLPDTDVAFKWTTWRLPTKDELEAIGHADGGWLYEDGK